VTAGEPTPIELTTSGDTLVATLSGDFDMAATFIVEPALERALPFSPLPSARASSNSL